MIYCRYSQDTVQVLLTQGFHHGGQNIAFHNNDTMIVNDDICVVHDGAVNRIHLVVNIKFKSFFHPQEASAVSHKKKPCFHFSQQPNKAKVFSEMFMTKSLHEVSEYLFFVD